jgi:hypothetical protein
MIMVKMMKLLLVTSLWAATAAALLDSSASVPSAASDLDLVVLSYSTDPTDQAMLWTSADAHSGQDVQDSDKTKMVATGLGVKLYVDPPRHNRGWMYRFRQVVTKIMVEYAARGGQDFLVLSGDATDVYLTKSEHSNTLSLIKDRYLKEFNETIVFSSQVYCCNPWNLRDVGGAAWDEHYDAVGGPETIYKHLNAGLYMGYATAIINMANELNVFETEYKSHEAFNEILATMGAANVHMFDVDVDDDEWQLSIWYLKEQKKHPASPRAVLDVHQNLFTTVATIRGSYRDGGYTVYSQNYFYSIIGALPKTFVKSSDLAEVTLCPYEYDKATETWINTITHSHPLLFHFAGSEWICACEIMNEDQFDKPNKFAEKCPQEAPFWYSHINQGIKEVSINPDPTAYLTINVDPHGEVSVHRKLASDGYDARNLSPYGPMPVPAPAPMRMMMNNNGRMRMMAMMMMWM